MAHEEAGDEHDGRGGGDDAQHSHRGHSHGHDHGTGETDGFLGWLTAVFRDLYHGMIEHPAFEKIEQEAEDIQDEFFFACFADAFGIPSPVSYYTVELLPYLAEDFEAWERRMWDRKTLLERKGHQYHFH